MVMLLKHEIELCVCGNKSRCVDKSFSRKLILLIGFHGNWTLFSYQEMHAQCMTGVKEAYIRLMHT
jgi:hypothetical protein